MDTTIAGEAPKLMMLVRGVFYEGDASRLKRYVEEFYRGDDKLMIITGEELDVYQLVNGRWESLSPTAPRESPGWFGRLFGRRSVELRRS